MVPLFWVALIALKLKDCSTNLTENFFEPVLNEPLAVSQKAAQSEQLNSTTFLGRVYRVKTIKTRPSKKCK